MISVNQRFKTGAVLAVLAITAAACSSDAKPSASTPAASTPTTIAGTATTGAGTETSASTATSGGSGDDGVTTKGISDARCAENKAAGKITYSSSFDFAASASIVDVVVAKSKGYFDKMCLDVTLVPGFSTTNYPLIAAGTAQFSSAGNYSEILNNTGDGADFVALVDYGKAPIEELLTPDGGATKLADLKGKTIGVKGDIPPSIVAMLAKAGLERGTDYKETLLDGFDPVAQLSSGIDALPVYKSNEPNQLDAAGVKYNTFDPVTDDIPGTFGLLYTSKSFAADHPTVVEDFTRAALHGMEDAIADPAGAVKISVAAIDAAGNQNYLTAAGELFRWNAELKVVQASTPSGEPVGLIDPAVFDAEYKAYVAAGVWPKGAPVNGNDYDESVAKGLYDASGKVIWPAG
ncbi:MAG: hypothetical protein JWN39_1640 [Ilumatobacteraceae bacterium]|nr:hypothetical protein [Ilumatobacteraceae bacterium]